MSHRQFVTVSSSHSAGLVQAPQGRDNRGLSLCFLPPTNTILHRHCLTDEAHGPSAFSVAGPRSPLFLWACQLTKPPSHQRQIASLEWQAGLESRGLGSSGHLHGRRDEAGQGGRSWFRRQQAYMKISHNYSVLKHLGCFGVWEHARWNGHFLGENGRGNYPVAPRCQPCGKQKILPQLACDQWELNEKGMTLQKGKSKIGRQ